MTEAERDKQLLQVAKEYKRGLLTDADYCERVTTIILVSMVVRV